MLDDGASLDIQVSMEGMVARSITWYPVAPKTVRIGLDADILDTDDGLIKRVWGVSVQGKLMFSSGSYQIISPL